MGVVCFRIKGADAVNSRAVEMINASGRSYLMQTKLRGRAVMRLGLGNILTTEENVRRAWSIIQDTAEGGAPNAE